MAKVDIDSDLELELFKGIRILEGENLKTKKYDDRKMVTIIMNYIKKLVDDKEGDSDEV
ncbi:hypothetical protein [Pseudobutyrivibrio xylanivorans]|uniref:Uncharacterized protein n=1 Tax=Pseudobutyrivibrio xylanivorans DSM 14809 TaxID=1123012 RepID=A0A1M6JVV9_PSEXY|nr:hypothetical protein [Pseudobutyrivibrio xylanivorans]SHJ50845.1 hypothetical protein SAMN02745725_02702 [Pseudobutyrivibrio xylanivorans DSM 14809]